MDMEAKGFRGCYTRSPIQHNRKRRFTGCGIQDIDSQTVKSWFKFRTSPRADGQQALLNNNCMRIDLYRKGKGGMIASYDAFSTDNDGRVAFYWDDVFLLQPAGFYTGDVFIDENYCFSLAFRIRKCEVSVDECFTEREVGCSTECADIIGTVGIGADCAVKPCIPQDELLGA